MYSIMLGKHLYQCFIVSMITKEKWYRYEPDSIFASYCLSLGMHIVRLLGNFVLSSYQGSLWFIYQ